MKLSKAYLYLFNKLSDIANYLSKARENILNAPVEECRGEMLDTLTCLVFVILHVQKTAEEMVISDGEG